MKNPDEELGRMVRALRRQAGMTQAQLASRSYLTRTSITNLELGNQTFTSRAINDIADALGYTVKVKFVRKQ